MAATRSGPIARAPSPTQRRWGLSWAERCGTAPAGCLAWLAVSRRCGRAVRRARVLQILGFEEHAIRGGSFWKSLSSNHGLAATISNSNWWSRLPTTFFAAASRRLVAPSVTARIHMAFPELSADRPYHQHGDDSRT